MPESINKYELFQMCLGPEPEEGIRFAVYENDLGEDGVSTSVRYGAETGRRRWRVTYPTLAGASGQANVSIDGMTLTPEAYLWDLFCRTKNSGVPFVIQSPRNDQYYLAKFVETELTFKRMLAKLYSVGVELVQKRIPGVTVFDPSKLPGTWGWYDGDAFNYVLGTVTDRSGHGHNLEILSDVIGVPNAQNGNAIARFNSIVPPIPDDVGLNPGSYSPDDPDLPTGGGYIRTITESPTIKEAFFAMKMREDTFSNYGGILTAAATTAAIVGESGTSKFYDLLFADYEYRKNSILYAAANQQAPMNRWGLIHARWKAGVALVHPQVGRDRDFAGRYPELDLGEFWLGTTRLTLTDAREAAEHWQARWAI